jgi:hypothetical protein
MLTSATTCLHACMHATTSSTAAAAVAANCSLYAPQAPALANHLCHSHNTLSYLKTLQMLLNGLQTCVWTLNMKPAPAGLHCLVQKIKPIALLQTAPALAKTQPRTHRTLSKLSQHHVHVADPSQNIPTCRPLMRLVQKVSSSLLSGSARTQCLGGCR